MNKHHRLHALLCLLLIGSLLFSLCGFPGSTQAPSTEAPPNEEEEPPEDENVIYHAPTAIAGTDVSVNGIPIFP